MINRTENYRPQYHFTPETGWMNDPNGMVFYDGEYHLFYQYTPDEIYQPRPKHWGHAVSTDLLHWEHLPVALSPDALGEIWSGSVVVDWENTSGLQTGDEAVLVAIFTHFDNELQQQSIAASNDRGRTWMKYSRNPVIPDPGLSDFRDPKVFWHAGTKRWVMVLAAGDRVMFYTSPDLIDWQFTSQFGETDGTHTGVWECPDLFPLNIGTDLRKEHWVLLVSVGSGAPNGGSGTQYFIGNFDGENFTNHQPATTVNWLDYGADNYAGVTFSDIPVSDGRRILIGWMNNWDYAYKVPTSPWRGAMTVPRRLQLATHRNGTPKLISFPVSEVERLRQDHTALINHLEVKTSSTQRTGTNYPLIQGLDGRALEMSVAFEAGTTTQFGIRLLNKAGDQVQVGYDLESQYLFVDRRSSGKVDFHTAFGDHIHTAPLLLEDGLLYLQIFLDSSSIEVFGNNGNAVITDLIFPGETFDEIECFTQNGDVEIIHFDIWELRSTDNE